MAIATAPGREAEEAVVYVAGVAQRWGLTLPLPGISLADHEEHVKAAEAAGYTDFWSGETNGPDGFTPLALSAAWTERARLGTGIVGVFQRGPALLAQEAAALDSASRGRFVLGIGSSSDRIVEGWNGIPFERPLSRVRETLEFLRTALDGERTASGFKLETAPAQRVPIVLAALRGKMLDLAVERADGAFTNFLPLGGLPKVTAQLEDAPDGFELLCRFFCLPGEREAVEPLARFMFSSYITVPVYAAFYRWLGYGDEIDTMVAAWESGDRQAAAAAAPWNLIEEMFIFGTPEQMKDRIAAFVEGGITLPILTPITTPDKVGELIAALGQA
jgi:probable F420-dependent oxidoreductase